MFYISNSLRMKATHSSVCRDLLLTNTFSEMRSFLFPVKPDNTTISRKKMEDYYNGMDEIQ